MLNQYVCFFIISIKIMTISIQFTILACNKSILNFEFCQDRTTATISFKIEYLKIPLDYNDDIAIIFLKIKMAMPS